MHSIINWTTQSVHNYVGSSRHDIPTVAIRSLISADILLCSLYTSLEFFEHTDACYVTHVAATQLHVYTSVSRVEWTSECPPNSDVCVELYMFLCRKLAGASGFIRNMSACSISPRRNNSSSIPVYLWVITRFGAFREHYPSCHVAWRGAPLTGGIYGIHTYIAQHFSHIWLFFCIGCGFGVRIDDCRPQ